MPYRSFASHGWNNTEDEVHRGGRHGRLNQLDKAQKGEEGEMSFSAQREILALGQQSLDCSRKGRKHQ